MRLQNILILIVSVFLFQGNCSSDAKEKSVLGLWYFVDKDSVYWEEIYTDSLFWVYSDEVGVSKRKYKIEKNIIEQSYLDGSAYLDYEILKISKNSISFVCKGEKGELKHIDHDYDLDKIVSGDKVLIWKYIQDYRRRKYDWEHNPKD